MLDSTLMMWSGEFGRTPKINGAAGRDHCENLFSVIPAGVGMVHGSSDRLAAYPTEGQVRRREQMTAMLYCLGMPSETEIRDALGSLLPVSRGEVIRQIL